jgi:hypothetical protein
VYKQGWALVLDERHLHVEVDVDLPQRITKLLDGRRLSALLKEKMRLVLVELAHLVLAACVQQTHAQVAGGRVSDAGKCSRRMPKWQEEE